MISMMMVVVVLLAIIQRYPTYDCAADAADAAADAAASSRIWKGKGI